MIVIATRGEKVDVWVNVDLFVGDRILPDKIIKREWSTMAHQGGDKFTIAVDETEEMIPQGYAIEMFADDRMADALEHLARITGRARALRYLLIPALKEPHRNGYLNRNVIA